MKGEYKHLVEEMIALDWGRLWSWDLGLLKLSGMRMLTRLIEISVLCALGDYMEEQFLSYLTLTGMGGILLRSQSQFPVS